jgi:hypothetical protein
MAAVAAVEGGAEVSNEFTPGRFEKWYYRTDYREERRVTMTEQKVQLVSEETVAAYETYVQDHSAYPILADIDFPGLIKERQANVDTIALLTEHNRQIDDQLKSALDASGVKSVYYGRYLVTHSISQGRRTLDKLLLIKNGVTPQQIEASYKVGKGSSFIRVGEKEEQKTEPEVEG